MRRKTRTSSYAKDVKGPLFSEKPTNSVPKASEVDTTCPICQELVGYPNPEGITEDWSSLPCGHRFGGHCIKQYLRIVADDRPSCPICRQVAYHGCCGHPVLPTRLSDTAAKTSIDTKKTMERVRNLHTSFCSYCQSTGRSAVTRARRPRKIKAFFLSISNMPRKLLARSRRDPTPGYVRRPLLVPWDMDEDAGPWVDPWPRSRDPAWERWWDSQQPILP
ncbi:hypothetical protein B0T14DRAFT_423829 [Immersiella caudata]|uniref:RING-type domain-containing protein n=1 Tax=Immersiella caudata TaxID=314043 RepID=A0AA40C6Z5_9PEZI|nr:hypothetical protein B0T14DRAFT_423829 [Immersiella caudata]